MKRKFVILAMLLSISCTACSAPAQSQSNNHAESNNASTSESANEEIEPEIEESKDVIESTALSVGETTYLGDWEITLDSFEVTDKIDNTYGSFSPSEGNKYVVIYLMIKNNGTSADTFVASYSFSNNDVRTKILYKDTYEYSSTNLLGLDADLHDDSLNPLTSLSGLLAYEVVDEAANSEELTFVITKGKETVVYNLK